MLVNLLKKNTPTINNMTKEQQYALTSVNLSYEELNDMYIMAMVFGHGVDTLIIEICETENIDSLQALMTACKSLRIVSVENCNSTFELFSRMYPEKKGELRRAKMLGKNMLEVIKDE